MNVGIIGLGLMGASFAKSLKKNTKHKVFGFDISNDVISRAKEIGAIDEEITSKNIGYIDILILAIVPNKIAETLDKFLSDLKNGATVIDFCGIKRCVVDVMEKASKTYPELSFIGGHPMAGREFSGINHSVSDLFDNAPMILVNVSARDLKLEEIKGFFIEAGFRRTVITTAEKHDAVIAYTSQLCHIVSNAYIKNKTAETHDGYSAGSYRDLTRVARLNPEMWANLMIENADYLEKELSELVTNLNQYLTAIKKRDEKGLKALLNDGNNRKLAIDVKGGK